LRDGKKVKHKEKNGKKRKKKKRTPFVALGEGKPTASPSWCEKSGKQKKFDGPKKGSALKVRTD